MGENENWYLVLELEFDPPVEDESVILKRIDEKRDYWNRNANHFRKGAQYQTWARAIPQITHDMTGSENRRSEIAKEACTLVYGEIDGLLKKISRKGYISSEEIANIAKKLSKDASVIKKRVTALKLTVRDDSVDYKKYHKQYYLDAPAGAKKFGTTLPNLLRSAGKKDLYDFLYGETKSDSLPAATLKERATEKRKEFRGHDAISSTGNQLCGQCEIAFKDEISKKEYDDYLAYLTRKNILNELKDENDISKKVSFESFEAAVNKLTSMYRDHELALKIVRSFCECEGIIYSSSDSGAAGTKPKKICRCGTVNDSSRSVCSNCGLPLDIKCPNCHKLCASSINICDCGFNLRNIDRCVELCNIAAREIDEFNFAAADLHIQEAESCWKGYPKIAQLKSSLINKKKLIGNRVDELRKEINQHHYYRAKDLLAEIKRAYPGYEDSRSQKLINDGIAEAKKLFDMAQSISNNDNKVIELCRKALDFCGDYPGIKEFLKSKISIDPPVGFNITSDTKNRTNILSWRSVSKNPTEKYRIVRKINSAPSDPDDGECIAEVSMCSYSDKKIEAAVVYYYAVFAEFSGIYSKPAISERPVINLFEISGLSASIGNGSVELSWETPPKNTIVHIFEIHQTGQHEIKNLSSGNKYVVSGLANGHEYSFRAALEYIVNGKTVLTSGMNISGLVPIAPPKPVEVLSVRYKKDDDFELMWNYSGEGEVKFYSSYSMPTFKPGDTISIPQLEKQMTMLMINMQTGHIGEQPDEFKADFRHRDEKRLYIAAVTVKSGAVVFGATVQACKVGSVAIENVREESQSVYIYIRAPKNAVAYHVLYSFDHQPSGLSDKNCIQKRYTDNEYSKKGALIIPNVQSRKYHIAVFAEFKNDDTVTYSSVSNYVFNNQGKSVIDYSITVIKRFFKNTVEIKFMTENGTADIPAIDICGNRGDIPIFYNKSNVVLSIDLSQTETVKTAGGEFKNVQFKLSDNGISLTMPVPSGKNMYIKPFIANPGDRSVYELKLTGGDYKIN
ncbi:MAG: hypothetical protein IJ192_08225 [Clostridia bacterium]|nr:hypothetical protein [Clostridia bacterium]MBR2177341.1 hypothetical protein [Clostridia bacterium]